MFYRCTDTNTLSLNFPIYRVQMAPKVPRVPSVPKDLLDHLEDQETEVQLDKEDDL